jgi:hypothetical protein
MSWRRAQQQKIDHLHDNTPSSDQSAKLHKPASWSIKKDWRPKQCRFLERRQLDNRPGFLRLCMQCYTRRSYPRRKKGGNIMQRTRPRHPKKEWVVRALEIDTSVRLSSASSSPHQSKVAFLYLTFGARTLPTHEQLSQTAISLAF